MKNRNLILITITVLIALFVGAAYIYKNNQTQKLIALAKEKAILFERPYSFVLGNKDAKVQLVEFFDPACETCALFHPYVKEIMKKYDGEIKLVLRYAPFHQNSNHAVKMLEGARAQGKFMETLEFMFDTQKYWVQHHTVKPEILWQLLGNIKDLDMNEMAKFLKDPKNDEIIIQDLKDAKTLGVTKTPGYIVNGKPLQIFGLDNLIDLIESERSKK